jgi:hypothetical protein
MVPRKLKRTDAGRIMERRIIEQNLARAAECLAFEQRYIANQRERVAQLERQGLDSLEARRLLAYFQQTENLRALERDRLLKELEDARE